MTKNLTPHPCACGCGRDVPIKPTSRDIIARIAEPPMPPPADGRTVATAKNRPRTNPEAERSRKVFEERKRAGAGSGPAVLVGGMG